MLPRPWLVLVQRTSPPDGDGWLAAAEREHLAQLAAAPRRRDWRLGRWAAKAALGAALEQSGEQAAGPADLARLAVLAADDGAPLACLDGSPMPLCLSLSHRGGLAACTVAPAGTAVGCDLELVEPRSAGFVADYLTAAERATVAAAAGAGEAAQVANLIWSAKESALKALRVGLTRDTRSVEVSLMDPPGGAAGADGWHRMQARDLAGDRIFTGWWRRIGSAAVLTLVVSPAAPDPPAFFTA